jgi:hypothetical protein
METVSTLLPGITPENPEYEKFRDRLLISMVKQYDELLRQEEAQRRREARMKKSYGYGNNSNKYKN